MEQPTHTTPEATDVAFHNVLEEGGLTKGGVEQTYHSDDELAAFLEADPVYKAPEMISDVSFANTETEPASESRDESIASELEPAAPRHRAELAVPGRDASDEPVFENYTGRHSTDLITPDVDESQSTSTGRHSAEEPLLEAGEPTPRLESGDDEVDPNVIPSFDAPSSVEGFDDQPPIEDEAEIIARAFKQEEAPQAEAEPEATAPSREKRPNADAYHEESAELTTEQREKLKNDDIDMILSISESVFRDNLRAARNENFTADQARNKAKNEALLLDTFNKARADGVDSRELDNWAKLLDKTVFNVDQLEGVNTMQELIDHETRADSVEAGTQESEAEPAEQPESFENAVRSAMEAPMVRSGAGEGLRPIETYSVKIGGPEVQEELNTDEEVEEATPDAAETETPEDEAEQTETTVIELTEAEKKQAKGRWASLREAFSPSRWAARWNTGLVKLYEGIYEKRHAGKHDAKSFDNMSEQERQDFKESARKKIVMGEVATAAMGIGIGLGIGVAELFMNMHGGETGIKHLHGSGTGEGVTVGPTHISGGEHGVTGATTEAHSFGGGNEHFTHEAFTVHKNEGGYELYKGLGLKQSDWDKDAPKLIAHFGKDTFYNANGDIRIRPTGELKRQVENFIMDLHK